MGLSKIENGRFVLSCVQNIVHTRSDMLEAFMSRLQLQCAKSKALAEYCPRNHIIWWTKVAANINFVNVVYSYINRPMCIPPSNANRSEFVALVAVK